MQLDGYDLGPIPPPHHPHLDPTQKFQGTKSTECEFKPGEVACLDYFDGAQPATFMITDSMKSIFIGRDPKCDIPLRLTGESGISSRHIEIQYNSKHVADDKDSGPFTIIDVSSTGIFHNNVVPDKGVALPLCHRDEIRIGHFPVIVFHFRDAASTPKGIHLLYDLRKKIGTGNFSEVKLGISRKNGKKYAIKVLDRKRFDAFSRKRNTHLDFETEVKTLEQLKHRNIVHFFEYKEEGDLKYMVTEFLEGGDLLQRLLDIGKYTDRGTRHIFVQILSGLRYLHGNNIVHRDLKPENILLADQTDTANAKIADFGLAGRITDAQTAFKTFCGTPHYFAPELIQSQQNGTKYGKEVDLWSAGVILYILLSGTPPFEDENLYQQILQGSYMFDVEEWNSVPTCSKDLVSHLMDINPLTRYTVEQALMHEYMKKAKASQTRPTQHRGRSRSPVKMPDEDRSMVENLTPIKECRAMEFTPKEDVEMT